MLLDKLYRTTLLFTLVTLLQVTTLTLCAEESTRAAHAAMQERLYPLAENYARQALHQSGVPHHEPLLILLESLYKQSKHSELLDALTHYASLIQGSDNPAPYALWQARAELAMAKPEAAAKTARAAVAAATPSYRIPLLRIQARASAASGNLTNALELYTTSASLTTNTTTLSEIALEQARLLHQANRDDEALATLATLPEINRHSTTAIYEGNLLRGTILLHTTDNKEGHRILNQLAMNDSASEKVRVQALVEMSSHSLSSSETNKAVAYARNAFDRATLPDTRRAAGYWLGDLLSSSSDTIDEGEKIIKPLIREFPESTDSMQAQLKLADALLHAARPERAATEYKIFLETYPASSMDNRVLQGRGWALLQLGRYTEAANIFKRAADLATSNEEKAEALFKQGDALLAGELYAEAAAVYNLLAREMPTSRLADTALYQHADALERAGKLEEAAVAFRRVAVTFPKHDVAPQALLRLAAMRAAADANDEALATYTEILEAFNQSSVQTEALMGRAKVYYRLYRFNNAMQDFAAVAEGNTTNHDEARFFLVLSLYGLGRDRDAQAAATSFLLDFPDSPRQPDMTLWLGKIEFNRNHFNEARQRFSEFATRWPTNPWADAALLWGARAAIGEADYTGAVELIARLVRDYPNSQRLAEARLVQGDALIELARFSEAVLLLDQIVAQSPDTEWARQALLKRGDSLFAMGADTPQRYQEAMNSWQTLLQQPETSPNLTLTLNYKIGRCLEKLRRPDEALAHYYDKVILCYQDEVQQRGWVDDASTTIYVRTIFSVADLFEQKGQPDNAVNILLRIVQPRLPGEEEARLRINRLRKRGSQ